MATITNCPVCGGSVITKNLKGSTMPWKDFPFVDLSVDLKAEACKECNEVFLRGSDIKKLDLGLEKSIRAQTSIYLDVLKRDTKCNQKSIAKLIGLTESYISDLIGRKKTPSYQVFNHLKILAKNPREIKRLQSFNGNHEDISSHVKTSEIREKFLYLSDLELETLSSGSHFRDLMNEEQRVFH